METLKANKFQNSTKNIVFTDLYENTIIYYVLRPPEKPVLASEREARSRVERCRNKCLTTVGLTRRPDTDATEMVILCLHVQATPVVFGRAWRRDLHHVHRARINTTKHYEKECSKMKYLHSVIKNTN